VESVITADDIKPDFEGLKNKWDEMLEKYFSKDGSLNAKYALHVPCPFCKTDHSDEKFVLNGFVHKTCQGCKTIYVSPRLNDESVEELYSDDYYSEFYTRSMIPVFHKRKQLIGVNKFKQTIDLWGHNNVGQVLDIGAGIGEVTDVFREEGWSSHAIEMNPVAVEWLRKRGHTEVFHGTLDAYKNEIKFDIVMAWGVVEHALEPDDFLQQAYDRLKFGGLFVSEVPHGECFLIDMTRKTGQDPKRILMGEQHIVLYSTQAYIDLHERNGFELVHLQTNGLDVSTTLKELNINIDPQVIAPMQECIDKKMYGDLLRGFWRKSI